ncbi:4a-hydroxytetrahydrobiopterin dehydratase [Variovorax sp. J31P179]|uniref:4a-hydroxytetrahydrobiopterin dehydratase n=1 Tax=Variovorax sp. J31P179 TaxID=3053508 RepID=UPI002575162A|nr:4a-hydroxytetrahydrobiopterin dehydratase [Variovorax sp. J31P179]MDM0084580.1 4a-hydroxytetrahydrobiopterin dehydratase [Variovorax sp. J31P179]
MSKPNLFVSYRRADANDAVRALYFHLRQRFGLGQVFMDISSITSGDVWPDRLKRALDAATIALVVVGPNWLRAADQYGRRRLDASDDWVRLEIECALETKKKIIPLLIGGLLELPPVEALPASLATLRQHHHFVLNDNNWESDVSNLVRVLTRTYGLQQVDDEVVLPNPEKKAPPLTEQELDAALLTLPGWQPFETSIPRDYPYTRHELRRGYQFKNFKDAIEFLQSMVKPLNTLNHHPRIENQWRTVIVGFTTWDIGNRISKHDVDAAAIVDRLYLQRNQGSGATSK